MYSSEGDDYMAQHAIEQWTVKSYIMDPAGAGEPLFIMESKYELKRDARGGYTVTQVECRNMISAAGRREELERLEKRCAQIVAAVPIEDCYKPLSPGTYVLRELLCEGDE